MLSDTVLICVFGAGFLFGLVSFITEMVRKDKTDGYQLLTSIVIIVLSTLSFFIMT